MFSMIEGNVIKKMLESFILNALVLARENGELSSEHTPPIILEIPTKEEFGDYSCNLAMLLAKNERKPPVSIAEILTRHIKDSDGAIKEIRVEKPGFINFFLHANSFSSQLSVVLSNPEKWGRGSWGNGGKVLLEFVSANPTGPLHVGHGRGAAVGDALGRILEASGFDVSKEYYINDFGNQMDMLGRSTYLRYLESKGEKIEFPEDGYRGDYIREIATSKEYQEKMRATEGHVLETELKSSTEVSCALILAEIRTDLEEFRVKFNNWFSESSLYSGMNAVEETVHFLENCGYVYEESGAKWLASSRFGDEKDRVVVREDGRPTYLASDIAYHRKKFERGFDRCINVWGADHHGYLPRIQASLNMLNIDPTKLDVLFVQFVSLKRGGEPVQMSTRSGQFEELATVIQEVGIDAARFFFLMRSVDSALEFDLDLAKEQSSENPVYYVQYAHARSCSLFRQAHEEGVITDDLFEVPQDALSLPEERSLSKTILEWPETVRLAAERLEPHRIAFALIDLSKNFHAYYNRHRILGQTPDVTRARLALVRCIQAVLANGLELIGVSAPERM